MCTAYERTFSHMTEDQLDSSTEGNYVTGHRMACEAWHEALQLSYATGFLIGCLRTMDWTTEQLE
jgi:hypothetical protein